MPVFLNWARVYAISLLTANAKGTGITIIDEDHIKMHDYYGHEMTVIWNPDQSRYFRA